MRFLQVHLSPDRGGADVAISNLDTALQRAGHSSHVERHLAESWIWGGKNDLVLLHSFSQENRGHYLDCLKAVRKASVPHAIVMHDYWSFCHQTNLVMPNAGWKRCRVAADTPCCPPDRCQHRVSESLLAADLVDTDIVCFTRASAGLFRDAGFNRIHVIPHGVDTLAFSPMGTNDGAFRVLFTNAWGAKEIKGYLHWDWLKRHFKGRDDVVLAETLGQTAHRGMPNFLQSGDVALFLSLWEETFGLVVAEAMACGTPVISYPVGIAPEIIDGSNGIIVPTSNPADVADAIERLMLMSRPERDEMGERARRTILSNFTLERMASDYVALARELRS